MDLTIRTLILIAIVIGTTISTWVTGLWMRRRMQRALERKVTDLELTSISSWMKAVDNEQKSEQSKAIAPK